MVKATFETRHFTFESYGLDYDDALSLIRSAWAKHVSQNEAAQQSGHPAPNPDNVEVLEFEIGDVFRDGEVL